MPQATRRSLEREWDEALAHCISRLLKSREAVKLFLSYRGMPCTIPGIGYIEVGTYTREVSIGQLAEDFEEAERLRRRHYA